LEIENVPGYGKEKRGKKNMIASGFCRKREREKERRERERERENEHML
jgi:hypothetical protein